jgi:hypothetical protein
MRLALLNLLPLLLLAKGDPGSVPIRTGMTPSLPVGIIAPTDAGLARDLPCPTIWLYPML